MTSSSKYDKNKMPIIIIMDRFAEINIYYGCVISAVFIIYFFEKMVCNDINP